MNIFPDVPLADIEYRLLNDFQRDFPMVPRPYEILAEQLGIDEAGIIGHLQKLQTQGVISRVGAVFRPNAIGVSALAALAVLPERLNQVAGFVSACPEVNHNYQREHRFNLWFVAAAANAEQLHAVLRKIEFACDSGPVLVLPLLEEFHIDLGFDLRGKTALRPPDVAEKMSVSSVRSDSCKLNVMECGLLNALQEGLPLTANPFAAEAFAKCGWREAEVIARLAEWIDDGLIKRFGVVVRHHELGYNANAMVVWNVPEAMVSETGRRIARSGGVTLCYRRPRRLPDWPYNLFCMIHGKQRCEVEANIVALSKACGLDAFPHAILFSKARFKQRGARYTLPTGEIYGSS